MNDTPFSEINVKNIPGVFPANKKDGSIYYRASITYKRKHISLGSFDTVNKAHFAYREARKILDDKSIGIEHHTPYRCLVLDKWVVLINFRDNGIYIGKPVYIRKRYFEYYFSGEAVYKFDIDDLFFFTSHKLMRRNGHLFVADYGSQLNVANRYGIRSYAVYGRDYRFINGDRYDFRYENIEIINRYHGVRRVERKGKTLYRVKIHINGDFTVGTYDDETTAAIAFNKAIDALRLVGINKVYHQNFIETLSGKDYARIYSEIIISDKIKNYTKA